MIARCHGNDRGLHRSIERLKMLGLQRFYGLQRQSGPINKSRVVNQNGEKRGKFEGPHDAHRHTHTERERERPFAFEFFWWNNFPEVCSSTRNNKWEEPSSTGTKRKRWNTPGSITSPTATKVSLMTSYLTFGNISILITIKLRFGKIV